MRQRYTRMVVTGGAFAVAAVLAGCGQGATQAADSQRDSPRTTSEHSTTSSTGDQPTSEQPTGARSTSEAAEATGESAGEPSGESADSPGSTAPAAGKREHQAEGTGCRTGDIDVTLAKGDAAAGSYYAPLQLRNTGDESCTLTGYPGVSYVAGGNNHQVGPAAQRADGKSPQVTLNPGDVAHSTVRFMRVRNYSAEKCDPAEVRGVRVYLPGHKDSTVVSHAGTGCANDDMSGSQLTVEPLRPGANGR